MKIAASDLSLQSNHLARAREERSETLRTWRGQRPDFELRGIGRNDPPTSAIADISAAGRQALAVNSVNAVPPALTSAPCGEATAIESACEAAENDPFVVLIKRMLEWLTGEEVRTIDLDDFATHIRQAETTIRTASVAATPDGQVGWSIEYDTHTLHEEYERTTFSAAGTIRTADGQEITFKLDLEMTRSYREETHVSLRAGDAVRKDPLVVNFGGTAVQLAHLEGQRFRFDLDGDGRAENLPLFASGSGYLALDLNGNGRIDSGHELFGPGSGNGFKELDRLDDDGNGWIDENDSHYDQLAVWTPSADGKDELRSLAELDIGALGLAHVATPFALRGSDNADLGTINSSGLYLTETGQAGSLQEIDLTV